VACFADPDAHARGDRDPSCSVNVETGAWRCWGCGAKGGAFDVALARGLDSRQAFELKIAYGLAERDPERPARRPGPHHVAPPSRRATVAADEHQLAEAHARLARLVWPPRVLRDEQRRVWSRATLLELGCGWEHGRVLVPIRDQDGGLRGVLRYAPKHDHAPKMLAARGTRLGLIPHPAAEPSTWVVLVEGPADMISDRSRGLPAVAVPGDHAWEAEWAGLLAGRHVSVIMDCDHAGRDAAQRIAADLDAAGAVARVIDLSPGRADGYDLTDWLADRRDLTLSETGRARSAPPPAAKWSSPWPAGSSVGRQSSLSVVRLVAVDRHGLGCRQCLARCGRDAGEDGADGSVCDLGGDGDLTVGQSEPVAAEDLLLVFGVGFPSAAGGPRDAFERIRPQLPTGAVLADLLGRRDPAQRRAGGDRGAGRLSDPTLQLAVIGARVRLGAHAVGGSGGDRFQLGVSGVSVL